MAALEFASGYCSQCTEQRKVERPGTNHILHLLLAIVTFGFWIIVWIGVTVKFGGWRCSTCGSKRLSKVRR